MKEYYYKIEKDELNSYSFVIRTRSDIIDVLINTIKSLYYKDQILNHEKQFPYLSIIVDKMSRVFVFEKNRFFSFNFPFSIQNIDNEIKVIFKNDFEIEYFLLSYILSSKNANNIEEMTGELLERISDDYSFDKEVVSIYYDKCLRIITEILSFEIGYLRYEYDEDRCNGDIHPLNHIDTNFSSNAAYKFGISTKISEDNLIDLLNINTNCKYISI